MNTRLPQATPSSVAISNDPLDLTRSFAPEIRIVHRSPAVPEGQGPRVLVALDASWD